MTCSLDLCISVTEHRNDSGAIIASGVQIATDRLDGVGKQFNAGNGWRQQEGAITALGQVTTAARLPA